MSIYGRSSLDPGYSGVPPPSKYMRTDAGSYPGGVPFLTTRPLEQPSLNVHHNMNTNGNINITIVTATRDQALLNTHNLVFVDSDRPDKPLLRSLQNVNELLANDTAFRVTRNKEDQDVIFDPTTENLVLSTDKIMDRFKLVGVTINTDANTPFKKIRKNKRAFTITSWGAAMVMDYWSKKNKIVNGFSNCYLVLKQVKVYRSKEDVPISERYEYQPYNFQSELHSVNRNAGTPVHFDPGEKERYIWQFVPFFTNESHIYTKDYIFKNSRNEDEIGSYIHVGYVHEYPDVSDPIVLSKRNETSVARDVVYMHENGDVRAFQFFISLSNKGALI